VTTIRRKSRNDDVKKKALKPAHNSDHREDASRLVGEQKASRTRPQNDWVEGNLLRNNGVCMTGLKRKGCLQGGSRRKQDQQYLGLWEEKVKAISFAGKVVFRDGQRKLHPQKLVFWGQLGESVKVELFYKGERGTNMRGQ